MLGKKLHIRKGGASLGKAGGGLDIVCAGVGDALAKGDLLLVGQQAGLNMGYSYGRSWLLLDNYFFIPKP